MLIVSLDPCLWNSGTKVRWKFVGQVPGLRFSSTHTLPKRFSPNARDPESPNRENLSTRLKTFLGAKWRRFMASLAMDGIGLPSPPRPDTSSQHQSSYLSSDPQKVVDNDLTDRIKCLIYHFHSKLLIFSMTIYVVCLK